MARESFRLRRYVGTGDVTGVGSYVRGLDTMQTTAGASTVDQDAAIRSTGITTVLPTLTTTSAADAGESVFEAQAIEYNAVLLSWSLTEEFVTASSVATGSVGLISVAVVYSSTGFPETVADGELLVTGTTNNYLHQQTLTINTDAGPIYVQKPETGKWAYYTIFAYYNADGVNGSYFYDRLSSIEILVPKDYGSRTELWNRVPKYYREADLNNSSQLERFIDTFGFELDRTRTLIDAIMTHHDPLLAEAEAVNELATTLGLELGVDDIGVSRTRALLHDIGYLRKTKGTLDATRDYITAVTGSEITLFTGASAPFYTWAVHAQRANLVADPRFLTASGVSWHVDHQATTTTTRTNLAVNPSIEVASTGYTLTGTGTTIARVTTDFYKGTASLQVTKAAVASSGAYTSDSYRAAVTAGTAYTFSAYVKIPTGQQAGSLQISATTYNSQTSTTVINTFTGTTTAITPGATWARLSVTGTPTGAATHARISIVQPTAGTAGQTFLIDAMQVEASASATPYFDGSLYDTWSGYTFVSQAWTGTVGASTSTSTWYTTANIPTVSTTPAEGITITAGASGNKVAVVCNYAVPVTATNTYYISGDFDTLPATVYGGRWGTSSTWTDWTATTAAASVSVNVTGRYTYPMTATTAGTKYPAFLFNLTAGQSITLSRWMIEPNTAGTFFDGDTVFSGFLYQNLSSDYTWSGTKYASYSLYTTNRKKTQDAVTRLMPQILPVTLLGTTGGNNNYALQFDWIPGKV